MDIWKLDELASHDDSYFSDYLPVSNSLVIWGMGRLFPHFILELFFLK